MMAKQSNFLKRRQQTAPKPPTSSHRVITRDSANDAVKGRTHAALMGREHLQDLEVNWSHEPERSVYAAESRIAARTFCSLKAAFRSVGSRKAAMRYGKRFGGAAAD